VLKIEDKTHGHGAGQTLQKYQNRVGFVAFPVE
jgi:hypothetical protein